MTQRRRSVRVRERTYAEPGLYFVTACTHGRQRLFGHVASGVMVVSDIGRIARGEWVRTPDLRPYVSLDAFVVMPDHVHLLFGIRPHDGNAPKPTVGATRRVALTEHRGSGPAPGSVGAIIGQYKSTVTRRILREMGPPEAPVWQRSFHDRIVRSEREAEALRRYIHENPERWTGGFDRSDGHRV